MSAVDVIRGDQIAVQYVEVYFKNAGDDVPVPHKLPRVPIFAGALPDKHCTIRKSQMPNAQGAVYLVSDTAEVKATVRLECVLLSSR